MTHPKGTALVEQDLALIYVEEKPAFYARVEQITPDVKPRWWRVKFLMLTVPPQIMTWIIDDEQIRGADFTMGGTPIRIEKLVLPEEPEVPRPTEDSESRQQKQARILSLGDKKKAR